MEAAYLSESVTSEAAIYVRLKNPEVVSTKLFHNVLKWLQLYFLILDLTLKTKSSLNPLQVKHLPRSGKKPSQFYEKATLCSFWNYGGDLNKDHSNKENYKT